MFHLRLFFCINKFAYLSAKSLILSALLLNTGFKAVFVGTVKNHGKKHGI